MKLTDVLPEPWVRVNRFRAMMLCKQCDFFRIIDLNEGESLFSRCIFNKCIKQYPHKIDNGEFK